MALRCSRAHMPSATLKRPPEFSMATMPPLTAKPCCFVILAKKQTGPRYRTTCNVKTPTLPVVYPKDRSVTGFLPASWGSAQARRR